MNKILGQVFTPKSIVKKMVKLITVDNPTVLEPAAGDGVFCDELENQGFKNVTSIEIDKKIAQKKSIVKDFFDHVGKYDVIIGNPPYVDFKDISLSTKAKVKDTNLKHKPNLYMFFLEKCLQMLKKNGEIIFIIPTEWLMSASASNMISEFYFNYSIQFFEIVPENVWENASVTTAIIKIKKGGLHQKIPYYISTNKKIIMGYRPRVSHSGRVTIKVGGASGNNEKYKQNSKESSKFVVSSTERNGKLVDMNYIPVINEWIRKVPIPPKFSYQIFVNTKTRNSNPFYMINQNNGEPILYDASVLCLYCDMSLRDTKRLSIDLNKLNWKEMGIFRNGRFHFTQSILDGVING